MTSPMSPPGGTSVIHDLGYRPYDGARLSRKHVINTLVLDGIRASFGLGRSIRSKGMPMALAGLFCGIALLAAVITVTQAGQPLIMGYTALLQNLQVVVILLVAAIAPANVTRDLRYRVTTLYFSRSLTTRDYARARFASAVASLWAVLALGQTILLIGALLAQLPILSELRNYLIGLVTSLILALVVCAIAVPIASATTRRGAATAAIIAVFVLLSVVRQALNSLESETRPLLTERLQALDPFTLVDGFATGVLGAPIAGETRPSVQSGLLFAVIAAWLILGGMVVLRTRFGRVNR